MTFHCRLFVALQKAQCLIIQTEISLSNLHETRFSFYVKEGYSGEAGRVENAEIEIEYVHDIKRE